MPHRIQLVTSAMQLSLEAVGIFFGSIVASSHWLVATLVDKETMDQLRGGDGALIGAVMIVCVLWLSKIADGKRLDKRHAEQMQLQKENSSKLMELQAESIKAKAMMTQAVISMDSNIQRLTMELSERPCQLQTAKQK